MKLLNGTNKYRDRRLEIEYVATEELNPNSYNPNTHTATSFDLLVRSISYFGMTQPVVVRKETFEIIDGENRWRAASAIGLKEIPVHFMALTDQEMVIATIIHNRARGSEIAGQIEILDSDLMAEAPELAKEILLYER